MSAMTGWIFNPKIKRSSLGDVPEKHFSLSPFRMILIWIIMYFLFQIVSLFPKSLLDGSDNLPQNLQSFARYLNILAGNIFKSTLGYSDAEKKKAK